MGIKKITITSGNRVPYSVKGINKKDQNKDPSSVLPKFKEFYKYDGIKEELLKSGVRQTTLEDFKFTTSAPNVLKDNISFANSKGSYVHCDYFYNYHAKVYEDQVSSIDEKRIPSLYATVRNGSHGVNPNSSESLSPQDSYMSNRKISKELFSKISFNNIEISPSSLPADKFQNVILSGDISSKQEIKSQSKQYPYGIHIRMSSRPSEDNMRNFMIQNGLLQDFMNSYAYMNKPVTRYNIQYDLKPDSMERARDGLSNIFLNDLLSNPSFNLKKQNNPNSIIHQTTRRYESKFSNMIYHAMLKSFYMKLMEKNSRDYKEIISGKSCYSEILFYKVEKFVGNSFKRPIQTFYIENTSDSFELIDTQVKVNTLYNYSISEVRFVIGNRISISEIKQTPKHTEFDVENIPLGALYEIPLYSRLKTVGPPPPPPPRITFRPRQNSKKSIYLDLAPTVGEYHSDPVIIEQEDQLMQEMINSMRKGNQNKPIYKYFSGEIGYIIYRLSSMPKNYESFELNSLFDFTRNGIQKNVTVEDFVDKNKKYYYMTQAYNRYGLKSFPSTIYEVELVQTGDDSKIIQKEYVFPKDNRYVKTINMRNLLQIIPSAQQITLDPSVDAGNLDTDVIETNTHGNYLDRIKLGLVEDKVWGRDFKIRLTSKDTGRKIDLNVKFDIKKKKSNQQL